MTAPSPPRVVDVELDRTWTYLRDVQHGGRLLEIVVAAALDPAGDSTGQPALPPELPVPEGQLPLPAGQLPVPAGHLHPLATSAHFLAAPALGPAQVHVQSLRSGRSTRTVHAQLVQGGRPMLDAVVTAGTLGEPGVPLHLAGRPPQLPPVQACLRSAMPAGQPRNGLLEQLDMRVDPATVGGTGVPEVAAWLRYADGRDAGPLALLCLADALPPVTFSLGLPGWVPTVELTVHVRAVPAPGWLRTVQRAQLMQDGWLDETSEIWDSQDRLVAQGHQLAAFRP